MNGWMQRLDLWDNWISGTLPLNMTQLTTLTALSLGYNALEGVLPSEYSSMTRLTNLDLAGNWFTGTLPPEWNALSGLVVLRLNSNLLTVGFGLWYRLIYFARCVDRMHTCMCSRLLQGHKAGTRLRHV